MQPLDLASSAEVPHGSFCMFEGLRKCDHVASETVARRNSSAPITNFFGMIFLGLKDFDCSLSARIWWSNSSDGETGEYLIALLNILSLELLDSNMNICFRTPCQCRCHGWERSEELLIAEQSLGYGQAGPVNLTMFEHELRSLSHKIVVSSNNDLRTLSGQDFVDQHRTEGHALTCYSAMQHVVLESCAGSALVLL